MSVYAGGLLFIFLDDSDIREADDLVDGLREQNGASDDFQLTVVLQGFHHLADVLGLEMNADQDTEVFFDDYHKILGSVKTEYYFSKNYISDAKTLEHLKRLHNRLEQVRKI